MGAQTRALTFELVGGPFDGKTHWHRCPNDEWPERLNVEGFEYVVETDELDPPHKQTASFVGWAS